jgi:serine/threonine kinase 16
MAVSEEKSLCYMLFPWCSYSLRDAVNERIPSIAGKGVMPRHAPWSEVRLLQIFLRVCAGVQAMHEQQYSHRDIKLENVLFVSGKHHQQQPVLMDLGSAGPLTQQVQTRRQVLEMVEQAAQHTTMPYRPPELFEGGVRAGDGDVDFTKVDVWMLGATLHAMMYGASPFECDFSRSGDIQIVECTHLSVLGKIPQPPPNTAVSKWYSDDIRTELIEPMLQHDPKHRPTLQQLMETTAQLIENKGGRADHVFSSSAVNDDDHFEGDAIALMSTNRMV